MAGVDRVFADMLVATFDASVPVRSRGSRIG